MTTDRDFRVAEAIKFVESGSSQVDAAGGWAVARSTLQRHLKGGRTMKEAKEPFQRLSAIQEGFVADWILVEEEAGRAPNKRIVREFAEMMLPPDEDPPRLGKHWIEGFLRRNPTVSTKIGRPLEAARAKEASKAKIEAFYERLRGLIARHDIKPSGITNMDETGVQEGESVAGKVVGSALTKHTEVKKSDCTTWVTIIEGITANGRRLTPAVIFTGGSLQGQWFPPEIKPWKYDYSPSGWSNGEIALKWLKEVYLPETEPENNENWRLLVLDEHTTHVTIPFMYEAFLHHVIVLYLPPHSSHVTQPLDVGVFSPLKLHYRQEMQPFASFDTSAPEQKKRFLQAYERASAAAISSHNIYAGFRRAGIWPVKPRQAPESDRLVEPSLEPARPSTPNLRPLDTESGLWHTPQGSQDLKLQGRSLERKVKACQRDLRVLIHKAGKALDQQSTETAALKVENERLREEVASLKPQPRRAVKRNAQEAFFEIERIKEAQEAAEEARERLTATRKKKERKINLTSAPIVQEELQRDEA